MSLMEALKQIRGAKYAPTSERIETIMSTKDPTEIYKQPPLMGHASVLNRYLSNEIQPYARFITNLGE